ncbi:MAG: hypothetical protein ACRD3Q_20140 [Terriglobales bacterium]
MKLPPPPRRHIVDYQVRIQEFFAKRRDLVAASCVTRFPQRTICQLEAEQTPRRNEAVLLATADLGVVICAINDPITRIRRLPMVIRFRSDMRLIVYLRAK